MSENDQSWPLLGLAWVVQAAAAITLAVAVVILQLWILPEPVLLTLLLALILGSVVMLLLAAPLIFTWLRSRVRRTWVMVLAMAAVAVVFGWWLVVACVLGFGLLVIGFG
ncbi:hypothetical protein MUK71_07975 [Arthrobacter zhangbolii]|uniref:Uncharacterized protein n=1 Tax=Arthrobacter zhangbolii TaxID=2886936 RepID=A0A9X1S7L5_9MICC|nr:MULTISPECIES: hypothetical protein [Arthrobacter]MCC3271645.1 hypothetical protein [Arthrobacter zhangbolii]MDN3904713.1 hypothetical protein [Arthrobacter sp. YD2]UON93523.1 hypothetical protein MUK71_07975 [Arthrobacter zhangbolii]